MLFNEDNFITVSIMNNKTGNEPWEPYFGWNRVAYEADDVPDWGDHAVYEHNLGRRVPQDVVGRQVGKLVHGRRASQSQIGRTIRLIHLAQLITYSLTIVLRFLNRAYKKY